MFLIFNILKDSPQKLKALASKYLSIPLDIVNPKTVIKVPEEGFPYSEKIEVDDPDNIDTEGKRIIDVAKRGDLYIKFNIRFPTKLTLEQREEMAKIIRDEE